METSLTPETVTLPKERTYFLILAIFSGLVWLVCTVTIFPLVGLAFGGFFTWLAHGVLIARLKSEAVKVGPDQLPELAETFRSVCEDLRLETVPDLYVTQAGGLLNAFATRFLARDFVVVYSDLLEAYGAKSGEIRFLLGHEIGHVRSRHVLKNMLLTPGLFLPLLGSAYNRACESSCDRHGALASRDADGAVRAMMVLSGGRDVEKTLAAGPFSAQHHGERGFFVSLHEVFSSYPTLSKRVSDLLDLRNNQATPRPPRNPLAYVLALFCPGARYGIAGVLITFYLVFFLAGVAMPVLLKIREKAQERQLQRAVDAEEEAEAAAPPH